MDEVGRGTSTFDGLALAWASAAFLAERIKAFTLFATHYFEMTALPEQYSNTVNVHLKATEHDERIIFLHSVEQGPASQSYGIQVRSEEHTSELQSRPHLVCRRLLEKKKQQSRSH